MQRNIVNDCSDYLLSPSINEVKMHTLDLNQDVLLLASRAVCGLHSVETTVCTICIPDKQRAGSSYVDDVHQLFSNLNTVSVPDHFGNRATSDGHFKPDVVSGFDCQTLKVLWPKFNIWRSCFKNEEQDSY